MIDVLHAPVVEQLGRRLWLLQGETGQEFVMDAAHVFVVVKRKKYFPRKESYSSGENDKRNPPSCPLAVLALLQQTDEGL